MIRRLTIAAAEPLFALAEAAGAQASDTASRVRLRAECRLAHQVLTKGQPAVKREWALRYIGSCAQQQEVVLEMWKEPPVAQEELSRLFELSRKIRDRRIFRRAAKIADDVSCRQTPICGSRRWGCSEAIWIRIW